MRSRLKAGAVKMVDKVMESMDEPTTAVEPAVALPEVAAIEAVEPIAPAAAKASKPVKPRKVEAKVAAPAEKIPAPVAVIAEPAKPVKAPKLRAKPAKTVTKAPPAKLPKKAAVAPVPAVKPASKRPSTATPRAKTPSVKTLVGSAKAPTTRKELFTMATTTEFTDKMQTAFKDAQEKAKAAFGDAGTFAKGNVEAMVESSKILAAGLQDMTKGYVEETKTSFEAMTADVKDLAAVKSPTEFFEKQSALMRKNFDAAVAASSKNSEAMLKLVNEAFQPISTRVSLAVEKIKTAA
jgi:phasin family protein